MKISLIIPAGGIGKRFSSTEKKQFYLLKEKPVLYHTLKKMTDSYQFSEIVIGIPHEDKDTVLSIIDSLKIDIKFALANGGNERQDTVLNCLYVASSDYVMIHDAVRPFVSRETIENIALNLSGHDSVICGVAPYDTVKLVNSEHVITSTIDRRDVRLIHTPQGFRRELIIAALENIRSKNVLITDDASALELLGKNVLVIDSNRENIKITSKDDIAFAEYMLERKFF